MAIAMAAIGIVGGLMKANSQRAAAAAQASTERINSIFARGQADTEQFRGQMRIKQLEKRKELLIGKQVALTGKSGVKFSGSPLEMLNENYMAFEQDILMEKINANARERRLRFESESRMTRAGNILEAGQAQARATLLSTAGNAAGSFAGSFGGGSGGNSVGSTSFNPQAGATRT